MAKSTLFYTDKYKEIQKGIQEFLNQEKPYLSLDAAEHPRAVGDTIQSVLAKNFNSIIGKDMCAKYWPRFPRRDMRDMAFEDKDGLYYAVNVKSHRLLGTKFNMPNLISVELLAKNTILF
jgi:hypothetical protein